MLRRPFKDRGKTRLQPAARKALAGRIRPARLFTSTALVTLFLATQPVQAQRPESNDAAAGNAATPAAAPQVPASTVPAPRPPASNGLANRGASAQQLLPPPEPQFQANARFGISDSYVSNAGGFTTSGRPDYLAMFTAAADIHQHSRRISLDATYGGEVDVYARGSLPTQISNNLQLVGNFDAIPQYLSLNAKAFAQPVVISNVGIVTAGDRLVPNGFSNSYGYYINPDFRFRLGNFASSETLPSFGQVYFVSPDGASNLFLLPGIAGPQDTTSRSLTQKISSGPDFVRLNWDLIGSFSETDRAQGLLTEKAGIAKLAYALGYEISLLATGGYDAIDNSQGLNQDISGPVAMGGIGLKFGKDFLFQAQVGEKYRNLSFSGSLLFNISPSASITASADDRVETPEGQLLNNLTSLSARPDGSLGLPIDEVGNGTPVSLSSVNLQSQGNLSLDQNIARYQTAHIDFAKQFARYSASIGIFGTRRTILSGIFVGPQTTDSWGGQTSFTHDFSPLLHGLVGGSYMVNNELGGLARTFQLQSQITFDLSRQTGLNFGASYLDRSSSAFLQSLSPFTGNTNDFRITVGVSHSL